MNADSARYPLEDVHALKLNERAKETRKGKDPEWQKDHVGSSSSQSHLERTARELDDKEVNDIEKELERIWHDHGM